MSGFELTPFGPVPIGTPYLDPGTDPAQVAHLIVRPEFVLATTNDAVPVRVVTATAPQAAKPIKRGSLLQSVRSRIREIKAELKHLAALQSELAELERLLSAAKQKPIVRPLKSGG